MIRVFLDIETFSTTDLKREGMYRYAENPDTIILCMVYGLTIDDLELWIEGDPFPDRLLSYILDPKYVFVAHNAPFEITQLHGNPGKKIGWVEVPLHRWICTAARCAALNLPRSLDGAGEALELPVKKDKLGKAAMLRLSKPRKPSSKNPDIRWTPDTKPEEFQILWDYCVQDVATTIVLDRTIPDLLPDEQRLWQVDQVINQRGFLVDTQMVSDLSRFRNEEMESLDEECLGLTSYVSSQREQILGWVAEQGVELPDYTKDTIAFFLEEKDLPPAVRRVLEIRQEAGLTSLGKFDALDRSVCADNRLRGSLLFNGAAQTGRWAGRLFQPHNITRGTVDAEIAIVMLQEGGPEMIRISYDQFLAVLSSCIRGMIKAPDGRILIICDYAGIEARVVQWLAMDDAALQVFRDGRDVYKDMAASIFNVRYEDVTKKQRFVGKIAVLGLGYAMGWKKFMETCHDWGATYVDEKLARRTVKVFRKKYAYLKSYWYAMQDAAIKAIQTEGVTQICGRISYIYTKPWLYMTLPSGRNLCYYKPWITRETIEWEGGSFDTDQINFYGVDSVSGRYRPQSTYGGKLVENATQGVARCLLGDAVMNLHNLGHDTILHVHDEIVIEVDEGTMAPADLERIMCTIPAWAKGCPIDAEAFAAKRYRK